MKPVLVSSIAVACFVAYSWQCLAAEEAIKYASPDGRFALRITRATDDEYHPMVELIEKHSGRVLVTLHTGQEDTDLFDASEAILVWSNDSKRVAYGFRANPPGARVAERGALVCFWNGSGFDKVFLPEELPVPDVKFPQGQGGNVKSYGAGVRPLRWFKSGDLELASEDMLFSRDDNKTYTGVLRCTISFDAQHRPSVNSVGKTKTQVSK
jgi:hypothetical protein